MSSGRASRVKKAASITSRPSGNGVLAVQPATICTAWPAPCRRSVAGVTPIPTIPPAVAKYALELTFKPKLLGLEPVIVKLALDPATDPATCNSEVGAFVPIPRLPPLKVTGPVVLKSTLSPAFKVWVLNVVTAPARSICTESVRIAGLPTT